MMIGDRKHDLIGALTAGYTVWLLVMDMDQRTS
ncbi:hypothetical protein ACQKLN_05520 [Paenibacillus glucanolyticus]|nr:hypothetical protein [Paenibacillus sp. LBL]